ncbi:MAG: pyridine nucleotide-disulfide oxidoreductase, partial [Chloroflexi bacterium]|nr:pyridine nucleotide-disulfide oxidoreductase [Chloroflexota bacterium]
RQVTLVCKTGQALNSPIGRKLQAAKNVNILKEHTVVEVKGDEFARSIILKDPAGKQVEITADTIFVEQALTPMSQMVEGLVELDERGRVIVDCANRTNVPGLFAAGDVTNSYAEQVLVAVGEGAKAALSAYEYLLPVI